MGIGERWDERMRALKRWWFHDLPYRSRRRGFFEALTSTYWMFRHGPCHCWWFGKSFPFGAAKTWQRQHRFLWRYFHILQFICRIIHSRRDFYWKLDLDLQVFEPGSTWPRDRWTPEMRWEAAAKLARSAFDRIRRFSHRNRQCGRIGSPGQFA